MISLTEALSDQENLEELCRDREIETDDVFPPNMFYGMSTVIKEFARIDKNRSIKCVIPHGIVFNKKSIWDDEIHSNLPIILCYPEYRKQAYHANSKKIILSFSSPFVYANKMIANKKTSEEKKGLIFFPAHSTHNVEADMDYENIAIKLLKLDKKFFPITICIYWKDYLQGKHQSFIDHGFPVVSAGHIYDQNFLYRLSYLLSTYKFAASNIIGSSMFYAVHAGCSFFLIKNSDVTYIADEKILLRDHPQIDSLLQKKIIKSFSKVEEKSTTEQLNLTNYFLGTKYSLSPLQMRILFNFSELMFKIRNAKKDFNNQFLKKP